MVRYAAKDPPRTKQVKETVANFFAANERLARKIEPHLPQARSNAPSLYVETVGQYLETRGRGGERIVLDIGGGKKCHFVAHKKSGIKIVAVDISAEQLKQNRDADEKVVADVTSSLPFESGEVDVIASRFVLEHLKDLDGFVRESVRILKPGGFSIHLFPSKFAPYALLNQALPENVAQAILYYVRPGTRGGCGFPAYYHKCYHSAVERLFRENGLEVVETHHFYHQSQYFRFFLPLFLASALYDMVLLAVGAKNLCPYTLMVTRKVRVDVESETG